MQTPNKKYLSWGEALSMDTGTSVINWEIADDDGERIASGAETLRHEGNLSIRDSLKSAYIARLLAVNEATVSRFQNGVDLPDAEDVSLGSYRDNIDNV